MSFSDYVTDFLYYNRQFKLVCILQAYEHLVG